MRNGISIATHFPIKFCRSTIQRAIFLMITSFLVVITVSAQVVKITIKQNNKQLIQILNEIESKSGYSFLVRSNDVDLNQIVSIDAKDKNIKEILSILFSDKGIKYELNGKSISIFIPQESQNTTTKLNVIKKINCYVTDERDDPIIGATAIIKGTSIGAISDINGMLSISVPEDAKLLISFIGYNSQVVSVVNQDIIFIKLEVNNKLLDEIVVIGYGSVKKSDITGAVSYIKGTTISKRKTVQISTALQGSSPGTLVTRNTSAPDASSLIRIRGITTIGDANPLIILDGIPVDDIDNINPNDVENISILKDAASASIYGARAASGVILITTKRAKVGQLSLEYNFEYGVEEATRKPGFVGVKKFMEMVNELRWNDNGNGPNKYPIYFQNTIEKYNLLNTANPDLYPNTDWLGLILKNSAPRQSQNINILAGTKDVSTMISLAYDKRDALYNGRNFERYTARVNNDININKQFTVSADFSFKRTTTQSPTVDPYYRMFITPPLYAAIWSNGMIASGKDGANIYGQLNKGGQYNYTNYIIGGKVSLDYFPFKDLKLSAIVSPSLGTEKSKLFIKATPYTSYNNPNVNEGFLEGLSQTSLSEDRNDNFRLTGQLLLNYLKSFDNHNINIMAGYESYYSFNENLTASRSNYSFDNYPYLSNGSLENRDNSGDAYENAYRSYFGRIMYNFKNRYFIQGNTRRDGSSRFAKEYRWGTFPSFSGGWVISEESFLKDISFLSYLKLRGSWGTLGNERISNYPYQASINFDNSSLFYMGTTVVSEQSAAQYQYAIQNITWETTESKNLGLDANLFKNRLRITADYYQKTTKDMLLALEIPKYMGFNNPNQNTGKMTSKGWEVELSWNDKIGELNFSASANISDSKSLMGDLGGTQFLGDQIITQGSQFDEWYGYKSVGLYQTVDQVNILPKLNNLVKQGDIIYKDISGPNGAPDGKISPEYDRVLLGGSLPRYIYGGGFELNYKNFDFSILFQGVGQQNVRLTKNMITPMAENWGNFQEILVGNYWSQNNSPDQNLTAKFPRLTDTARENNYAMSDYWLFNGSYLRLKNISLGYSIPTNVTKLLGVQRIKINLTLADLLSIDKYPDGWDPEKNSLSYPITKSYILGLSVKF